MCILPFVVRIPIPPRPKIDNNIAIHISFPHHEPGRVAQSVARLTQEPEVPGPILDPATLSFLLLRCFKKDSCQLLAKVCARSTD